MKVTKSRLPFQLRKAFDPIIQEYFYNIAGEKFIFENLCEDSLVLDVGTGAGEIPILFRQTSHDSVAIDLSKLAVKTAKGSSGNSGCFTVADGSQLPFNDGVFDAVIANGLFNRVDRPGPFLDEFARVIKENGKILFDCNNKKTFIPHKKQNFQSNFTVSEMKSHLSASNLILKKYDISFFMSLNQKKLIQSERMPLIINWLGLWTSIFINSLAKQLPLVQNKGAHIWICAEPMEDQKT